MILVVVCVLSLSIPDKRPSVFWTTHQILAVWTETWFDHEVVALGTKEPSFDSGSSSRLVLNKSDAIVSRVNIELILVFRVRYELVDLITLNFLVFDDVRVQQLHFLVLCNIQLPNIDVTLTVTYVHAFVFVEYQRIWVLFLHYILVALVNLLLSFCV